MPALAIVIALVGGACGAPAQSAAPGGLPTPGPSSSGNLPGPTDQPAPGGSPGGIGGRPDGIGARPDDGQAPIPPLPDDIVAGG